MDTREAGKLGGSRNTPAQNAARARNAKLGGRPRKKYPPGMDYKHNDARTSQPQPVLIPLNRKPTTPEAVKCRECEPDELKQEEVS